MSILLFIVFGLVIGLVARALLPGRQRMGLALTSVVGMVGSLIGGFLTSLLTRERPLDLHPAGVVGSVIGAILLLMIVGAVTRRRALV